MPEPAHGTPEGYSRHYYLGEDACDPCKAAHAARIAKHRADNGRRDQLVNKARQRALRQLGREHPERLAKLYEQTKAEVFAEQRTGSRP